MGQFRDNYSGALIITPSREERETKKMVDEMREIRDEIRAERERIEELQQRGEEDGDETKSDKGK